MGRPAPHRHVQFPILITPTCEVSALLIAFIRQRWLDAVLTWIFFWSSYLSRQINQPSIPNQAFVFVRGGLLLDVIDGLDIIVAR